MLKNAHFAVPDYSLGLILLRYGSTLFQGGGTFKSRLSKQCLCAGYRVIWAQWPPCLHGLRLPLIVAHPKFREIFGFNMAKMKAKGYANRVRANMRGYYKKKANFFQKGINQRDRYKVENLDHTTGTNEPTDSYNNNTVGESSNLDTQCTKRPIQRHHQEYFNDFVMKTASNEFSIPGADGADGSAMILRPKPQPEEQLNDTTPQEETSSSLGEYNIEKGSILAEKSMLVDLFNSFTQEHKGGGTCDNLCMDLINFRPWGVFSSVILTCKSCGMESARTNLYEEIETGKKGRKHAAGSLRLASISQDMPIGPTEIQLLFAAVGLRAGSLTGLQKNAYKAAEITEGVARRDMQKWIEHAKDILADRGVSNSSHISAQFDVLYHSVNKANAQCPGQGAVQATATCVETVTPSKKVIAYDHVNKACLKGARLKGRGTPVICGHTHSKEHHECTATQARGRGIREYDMARRIAQDLKEEGASVTHLCTDSDGTARNAFADFNNTSGDLPPLCWYKDPSHLSRNMRNRISKHTFNEGAFGFKLDGKKWRPKERIECRKALALDVPRRVSLTLKNMRLHYKGNALKMKTEVEKVAQYMMKCYGGDHSSCKSSALAQLTGCTGGTKRKSWFTKSHTLKAQGLSSLCLNDTDRSFLISVINMKLSTQALEYVARGETSSKCEATNRAINKSLPKNKSFFRTSRGRVCSAIGRVNNSLLKFTDMKFTAMNCSLPRNSLGYKVLRKYQHKRELTVRSQLRRDSIKRKHALIAEKTTEHFAYRKQLINEGDYHKYQLDVAQEASGAALDALLSSQSDSLESYEKLIRQARSSALHRQEALDHAYTSTLNTLKSKVQSQRKRKAAARKRILEKNKARSRGTEQAISLRQEHSYGKL